MPLFFFHIRDGATLIEDPDGSELPDLAAAREEAVQGARFLLAEKLKAGEVLDGQRFEITSAEGVVLALLLFKDLVKLQ
ncbi:conserved protein of unknown function [Methylorubrum extorquens]|uniref:DUF6894 domain-containing protein n=1 Tax=Methylorubrum extorquens TaxID=408 RepID=A0A2N9AI17_METEX|nr:conserved protein of unknown function [Methylorubrum extorquens]